MTDSGECKVSQYPGTSGTHSSREYKATRVRRYTGDNSGNHKEPTRMDEFLTQLKRHRVHQDMVISARRIVDKWMATELFPYFERTGESE